MTRRSAAAAGSGRSSRCATPHPNGSSRCWPNSPPGPVKSAEEQDLVDQLEILAKYPFQPHRLARLRPIAYQKFVLMKKLDNLIGRADQLFRRDTIESVNESIQWYVLAGKALGARPERAPAHRQSEPLTFAELRPRLDVAGNAIVEMEHALPLAGVVAGATGTGRRGGVAEHG